MKWFTLKRQFSTETTSKAEAQELRSLVQQIEALDLPTLDKTTKSRIASDIGFGYHPYRKTFARSWEGAIAVLVVMVLVFAQSAQPGSALYGVKRGTEKVRTAVTQNVPLLDRFDDSPQHDNKNNSGTDDTKGNSSDRGSSSNTSGSNDSGTSSGSGDTSGPRGGSGGTDDGSGQGSSTPVPTETGSGLSGGDGSSGGNSIHSSSGKDLSEPIHY